MKTGAHLKIVPLGSQSLGVNLDGDPRRPEPMYFFVRFPGGLVEIARCDAGTYWVHTSVNRPDDCIGCESVRRGGEVVDGRMDVAGKHASECDAGGGCEIPACTTLRSGLPPSEVTHDACHRRR
jgi:hypothetical protein